MKTPYSFFYLLLCSSIWFSCQKRAIDKYPPVPGSGGGAIPEKCEDRTFNYRNQIGCDGKIYPNPTSSLYILPFELGATYPTGLTNCSSSYHGAGQPDQYAFDFDMPEEAPFSAARGGIVHAVEERQASTGGGGGNGVIIDHQDETYGVYLHSPKNGILVEKGDTIIQGQELGFVGRSGLAGYPHLHFIVVQGDPTYPYQGIPVSFKNADPPHVVLGSHESYSACDL